MRALTERDYQVEAEPHLRKIFLNEDPCHLALGPMAKRREILHEYKTPDEDIISAIVEIASEVGDTGIYLSIINRSIERSPIENWWIPFSDIPLYLSEDTDIFGFAYQLESVIYSPNGKWGLIHTFQNCGILVGTEEFFQGFSRLIPTATSQLDSYLSYLNQMIQHNALQIMDFSWIGHFLVEMYGVDKAKIALEEHRLSQYILLDD